MMTVDDSLKYADDFCSSESYMVCLADEVRRLRDEVNGLTGSLDRAESVLQNLMSFLSVNGCWADLPAEEAEKRIRDGIDMLVRPVLARAEAAEAALKEAQEQEPLTWETSSELMDILKNPIFARPVPANLVGLHHIARVEMDGGTKFYAEPVLDQAAEENRFQSEELEALHMCLRNLLHKQQPFITSQSGSGQYKVVLEFKSIGDMHDFHKQLINFIDAKSRNRISV